jgi:hypothetical protein
MTRATTCQLAFAVWLASCAPPPQDDKPTIRLGSARLVEGPSAPVVLVPAPWSQVDVGWLEVTAQAESGMGATGTIDVDVDGDARLAFVAVGAADAQVGLYRAQGPSGVVVEPTDSDGSSRNERALSRGYVGAWRSLSRTAPGDETALIVFPSGPIELTAGTWSFSFLHARSVDDVVQVETEPLWLSVWRLPIANAQTILPVSVHVASAALQARALPPAWTTVQQRVEQVFSVVGVQLDWEVDSTDAEERFRSVTQSINCRDGELGEFLSANIDIARAHVLLVDDVTCAQSRVVGLSSAVPGVAHVQQTGGVANGVVIDADELRTPNTVALALAHELGHLLGLFHSVENDAFAPRITDQLPDTPDNDDDNAAANLMHFRIDDNSVGELSPLQGELMRAHPWMLPTDAEE